MKALFKGSLSRGIKLVGIFDSADCEKVAAYMSIGFPPNNNLLDNNRELTQFVDIESRSIVSGYGDSSPSERTLLAMGSLTRGMMTIGPYPNRNAALTNAIALNFGSTDTGYYAIEQAPEYESLRKDIAHMLESHALLI